LLGATGVILDVGSDLTDHFGAVHRELRNVLAVKKDQAERGSFDPTTLLVLDASRLGLSWLRPESVWGPMLARLELDWAEIPFVGFMLCFTSLSTLHVGGVLIKRPDIEARQSQAIDAISQVFGFAPPNA
jgi:hypothetical protein